MQTIAEALGAPSMTRWHATVYYRTNYGMIKTEHVFQEISALERIIEQGPNWYALECIIIRYLPATGKETIEQLEET